MSPAQLTMTGDVHIPAEYNLSSATILIMLKSPSPPLLALTGFRLTADPFFMSHIHILVFLLGRGRLLDAGRSE